MLPSHTFLSIGVSFALLLPPVAAAQTGPPAPKYKIEILSAAGKLNSRKKGVVSSESVIRVTDSNDIPVAGATVMFVIAQLSNGSAAFANGAASTIVSTNAAGIASTGAMGASASSTFNISVTASVAGQSVTTSIPVSMSTVAAGAGGGAAGAGTAAGGAAGAGAGISGAMIGIIVAVGAAAAIGAGVALGGGKSNPTSPVTTTPPVPGLSIRIGGPGTATVGAPRP